VSRKRWMWIGAGLIVVLCTIAYWAWTGPIAYARIATGYVAQQTCACVHVSNRSLDACLTDFAAEDIKPITITAPDQSHISAEVLGGLVRAEAVADGAYGCRLVD
jgi:hypothetical protein